MSNSSNVISKETQITGDITAQDNIRIEGIVEGMVRSKTKITIGETAVIKGNITSVEAEISGKIDGEVVCSDILYLKRTAVVSGNITTQKLVVENGAVFNGKCQMTSNTNSLVVSKSDNNKSEDNKQKFATG